MKDLIGQDLFPGALCVYINSGAGALSWTYAVIHALNPDKPADVQTGRFVDGEWHGKGFHKFSGRRLIKIKGYVNPIVCKFCGSLGHDYVHGD